VPYRLRPSDAQPERAERDIASLRRSLAATLPLLAGRTEGDPLEARARHYLHVLRWPQGVECPRCGEGVRLLWLESRSRWNCYACRYQFSVTAGTLFHGSHLELWKWLVAVRLMTDRDGVSANELMRRLGGSYKTWWFTTHRIRIAIGQASGTRPRSRTRRAGHEQPAPARGSRGERYRLAYLHEHRWRTTNRDSPDVFRRTVRALLEGEGVSFRTLTGNPAGAGARLA
jgi:transposase-like protein